MTTTTHTRIAPAPPALRGAHALTPADPIPPGAFVYAFVEQPKFSRRGGLVAGLPLYVGKGNGVRPFSHVTLAKRVIAKRAQRLDPFPGRLRNRAWLNKLAKLIRTDTSFAVVIVRADLTDADAFALEVLTIGTIGRRDRKAGPLLNQTDGGDGLSSADARALHADPAYRAALLAGIRDHWDDPAKRAVFIARVQQQFTDPAFVKRIRAAASKASLQLWADPAHAAMMRDGMLQRWADPVIGRAMADRLAQYWADPANHTAAAERTRQQMADPVHAAKVWAAGCYNPATIAKMTTTHRQRAAVMTAAERAEIARRRREQFANMTPQQRAAHAAACALAQADPTLKAGNSRRMHARRADAAQETKRIAAHRAWLDDPATQAAQSARFVRMWRDDPAFRDAAARGQAAMLAARWADPAQHEAAADRSRQLWATPSHRRRMRRRMADPVVKAVQVAALAQGRATRWPSPANSAAAAAAAKTLRRVRAAAKAAAASPARAARTR